MLGGAGSGPVGRVDLVTSNNKVFHGVVRSSATQALSVLERLHSDDAWREQGTAAGILTTRTVRGIYLSARQAKALISLLEKKEARLATMLARHFACQGPAA